MAEPTEKEIITGCQKQERYWQEQLHRRYFGVLLKVCARYASNMEDAEQLVQDSFLRIFSKIDTYKNAGSFEGWLKKIAVNICLDFLRSKAGRMSMQVYANTDEVHGVQNTLMPDGLQQMEFKDLLQMIQSLPDNTRTVFNLFVFEGYGHEQISKALNITENTSAWHMHQARKALQRKIKSLNLQYHRYAGK